MSFKNLIFWKNKDNFIKEHVNPLLEKIENLQSAILRTEENVNHALVRLDDKASEILNHYSLLCAEQDVKIASLSQSISEATTDLENLTKENNLNLSTIERLKGLLVQLGVEFEG